MHVIKRLDQGGGYVANPGFQHSYTARLEHARKFATREEADAERCVENEVTLDVYSLLHA